MSKQVKKRSNGLYISTGVFLMLAFVVFSVAFFSQEKESDATILDLFSGERTQTARFSDVLVRLGHEKPRPYRLNGNNVFISVRHSFKPPRELIEEYQVALASEGLNGNVVMDTKSLDATLGVLGRENFNSTYELSDIDNLMVPLKGGLVPVEITDDYVRMTGAEPAMKVEGPEDIPQLIGELGPEKVFKAVRTIEMFKRSDNDSVVVATFSDDRLDITKMFKGPGYNNRSDAGRYHENLPACRSCERIQQFEDLDPNSTFIGNVYVTKEAPEEVISYYDSLYKNRGWVVTSKPEVIQQLSLINNIPEAIKYHRQYTRSDGDLISLTLTPSSPNGATFVDLKYTKDVKQN